MSLEKDSALVQLLFFAFVLFAMLLPNIIQKVEKLIYYSFGKIFFTYSFLNRNNLIASEKIFLQNEIPFYKALKESEKRSFEHRIVHFINSYNFYGREELIITREMKLLIAASAVALTFGFRKYTFSVLNNILVYPSQYSSKNINKLHKGEFNPRLKTLVFSWKDFLEGNENSKDNINLGIHEFAHIIHINSYKKEDINSVIFKKEFKALKRLIQKDIRLKNKLITSNYFRNYAFENHYELIAVMLENFIETPEKFKLEFPEVYKIIKRMLNFNFQRY